MPIAAATAVTRLTAVRLRRPPCTLAAPRVRWLLPITVMIMIPNFVCNTIGV